MVRPMNPAAPARRLKPASKVVHEVRCGTKRPASNSPSRKARTATRAASASAGSGSALKRKLCIDAPWSVGSAAARVAHSAPVAVLERREEDLLPVGRHLPQESLRRHRLGEV